MLNPMALQSISDVEQTTITVQRATITRLQQENKRLQQDLGQSRKVPVSEQSRINELSELVDVLQRKLEIERRQVAVIEQEIDVTRAKIEASRRRTSDNNDDSIVIKHITALEDRLERSQQKFGECITRNKCKRQEIKELQREVATVKEVLSRLVKDYQQKSSEIAIIRQGIDASREAAQEAKSEAIALKLANEKEQELHEQEISQLDKLKKADEKLANAQQQLGSSGRSNHEAQADPRIDPASIDLLWAQLQEISGCQSREEVVSHMKSAEQRNFHLYETCKRADAKVEELKAEISYLETELRDVEQQQGMGQTNEVVQQMRSEAEQTKRRTEACCEKHLALDERLLSLKPAIAAVASAAGAQLPVGSEGTGPYQELIQHLSCIESQARVIVAVYNSLGVGR